MISLYGQSHITRKKALNSCTYDGESTGRAESEVDSDGRVEVEELDVFLHLNYEGSQCEYLILVQLLDSLRFTAYGIVLHVLLRTILQRAETKNVTRKFHCAVTVHVYRFPDRTVHFASHTIIGYFAI
jgi:hypothetical protein